MKSQRRFQEVKFLSATFLFTLVLGAFAARSFMIAPELALVPASERNPASIGASATKALNGEPVTAEALLKWDCKDNFKSPAITSSHVRLKSKFCSKDVPVQMSVINKTNGYTASVFMGAKDFSTDFIELQEGLNEIRVQWSDAQGILISRSFSLKRLPVAEMAPSAAPSGARALPKTAQH